jgi:hypothetical protein
MQEFRRQMAQYVMWTFMLVWQWEAAAQREFSFRSDRRHVSAIGDDQG